ncbi:MAG TPA: hypothetical protein VF624_07560 [Tepidisphaeraceae bacterium]|jgi:hypothetical protein
MPRLPRTAAVLLLALPLGCEDKPAVSDPVNAPPAEAAAPATRSVAEAPRKALSLAVLPFTVQAPESWKVATHDAPGRPIVMLEGPLDGDEVRVTLAVREDVSAQLLKQLIETAKREKTSDPLVEINATDTGDVRSIHRRRVATTGATSQPVESATETVDWRISLFVSRGVRYQQYEMNFLGLTPAAYARNRQLLEAVIASLAYDARNAPL